MAWGRESSDVLNLRTVSGELRINLTAMQVQITDLVARMAKLETVASLESTLITKFSQHVENCERSNATEAAASRSLRRELRGYGAGLLFLIICGLGFLLYHGLPWVVAGSPR